MDIKNIISTISSLIPFWASNIIEYFGIGHEYSMLFNIVLKQMIIPLENYMTETILYSLLLFIALLMLCYKHNIIDASMFKFYEKNSLTIIGSELDNNIEYCDSMIALTECFIDEFKYCDILITNNSNHIVMLNTVKKKRLKNDLYLDIVRNDNKVSYTLSSYKINLSKFVNDALIKYNKMRDMKYIHLYGDETKSTYNYSDALTNLTYTLVHKYNLTNLINKKSDENPVHETKEDGDEKVKKAYTRIEKISLDKKIKAIYLIDNYHHHLLEEDIYISISRIGEITKFSLYSKERNLVEFLDKCENYFNTNINNTKYNYRLIIQGNEGTESRNGKSKVVYPKEILAINYHLIFTHGHKNYRIIENYKMKINQYGDEYQTYETDYDKETNMFKYIIEDASTIKFDDLVLTIKRYSSGLYSSNIVDYIFESDVVELESYINNLTNKYESLNKIKNQNKLYHFTLIGFDDGNPDFNSELIYNNKPLMFESFDNISSVHNDLLINDMKKLRNIPYYEKTGMKRKKSYLFHGEPGCGKTASIIALALYDKRHIIEIPMSLITTCKELEIIMNLSEIDDIIFENDEIIMLFDELDVGVSESLTKREPIKAKREPVKRNLLKRNVNLMMKIVLKKSYASYQTNMKIYHQKVLKKLDSILEHYYQNLMVLIIIMERFLLRPLIIKKNLIPHYIEK